ncbi:MAG: bifunctional metallophosphatase/5'-nucleotidase [bacterium]
MNYGRNVNYIKKIAISGLILLLLIGCGAAAEEQEITIIATNDIHGDIVAGDAFWLSGDTPPRVGGFPKFAAYMKRQRRLASKQGRELLYLDGGDFLSGTPESDILNGRPLVAGLNASGLDYTVFGNHEIDLGIENLKKRIKQLDAQVLATNLRYKSDDRLFPGTVELAVEELGGLKIGLFGLVPENTSSMALPRLVRDLIFFPEVKTARESVARLREKEVDIIIALTHIGLERDLRLAERVEGIDLIVGGHSHDLLWEPELVNNTIIVQAGGRLRNAGRLDLEITGSRISGHSWQLATLYSTEYQPDTGMEALMKPYLAEVDEFLSEKIGRTSGKLENDSSRSSPLGNLVTDVMREKLDTDFAFMNPAGIQKSLPRGEIRRRHLMRAVRRGNYLVELELTGARLRRVFERDLRYPDRVIQFSGGRVTADPDKPRGHRLEEITVDGKPLEDNKLYTVAVSDFVAARPIFREAKSRTDHPEQIIWELLEKYFKSQEIIEPPHNHRYQLKGVVVKL